MVPEPVTNTWRPAPMAIVLATVVIQLLAAAALGYAAQHGKHLWSALVLFAIGAALILNAIRFVAWGYLHHRFPLSHVYPLTSLFFPCVLALAALRGDSVTGLQIVGTLLITAGSFSMAIAEAGQGSTSLRSTSRVERKA